jgi:hypothetical protein
MLLCAKFVELRENQAFSYSPRVDFKMNLSSMTEALERH